MGKQRKRKELTECAEALRALRLDSLVSVESIELLIEDGHYHLREICQRQPCNENQARALADRLDKAEWLLQQKGIVFDGKNSSSK